ncbi:t-SNARE syntaxin SCDLUD_003979 [Saccharomycodes ludwigii]|uniref:t-SNARE syntaxin n=1 Tax=Saccharomycodes ludwigii TaxID=36035 RepID=UPI001E845389|nr:hypothetical protein SCDLUD_003979 [Saccharomycodes ludwigii]KAH3899694.1 hypothetical protein SCDLUD_003979 [Saccharomycodes ludwigii]
MNIRDRTLEFQRSVSTQIRLNKIKGPSTTNLPDENSKKSEFSKSASAIAHEIATTAQLLSKLAVLCKKKPMFNDNPVEIAELSFLIKRKIYSIESAMIELNKLSSNNASSQEERSQHSHNVMNLLSTKMKNISGDFKTVLEKRQQMEITNRDRLEKLSNGNNSSENNTNNINGGDIKDITTSNMNNYNNSNPFLSTLSENTDNSNNTYNNSIGIPSQQQLMLLEEQQQDMNQTYLQERNRAVETIESTIQEVGSLFQQLAHMVQEQGEQIQRIDDNVQDIDLNIQGAQRELVRYFNNISNNRWMAVKIFAVIFVFFLIWVLVN